MKKSLSVIVLILGIILVLVGFFGFKVDKSQYDRISSKDYTYYSVGGLIALVLKVLLVSFGSLISCVGMVGIESANNMEIFFEEMNQANASNIRKLSNMERLLETKVSSNESETKTLKK